MKYTNIQLSIHGIKDKYKIDLNEIRLGNSIGALENMLSKEDDFSIQVPTGLYNAISKNYGPHYTSIISARQVVTLNSVDGVISSIKSKLLQFVLDIADEMGEGDNITQTLEIDDIEKIKEFLSILNRELIDTKVNVDDLEDLNTQIKVIEDQLKREKPKYSILKNTIDIIKGIIAGFGANILTESTMIQLNQIGKVFGQ